MAMLLDGLLLLTALLHVAFMLLEMLLWSRPIGRRVFGLSVERASMTRTLAANQGLYNGFLAAGLIWAWWSGSFSLQVFFLCCVLLAGLFGALTVSRTIFWVQGFPALLALLVLQLQ
jgi:putative membrane protein